MKTVRFIFVLAAVTGVLAAGKLIVPTQAQQQLIPTTATDSPPFDFADAFYTENGINVGTGAPFIQCVGDAGGRVGDCTGAFGFPPPFPDPENANWVTDTSTTDPVRTSTRVLQTTGGFDKNGNLIYYSIMGTVNDQTFFTTNPDGTLDANGQRAMSLGDQFRAFISPKQFASGTMGFQPCGPTNEASGTNGAQPCWVASPAPPNRRQDNVFDTQNTYFCQNLLGLWRLVFETFTSQAYQSNGSFASSAAKAVLSPLGNLNGVTLDGTPVLETTAEMDGLTALGYTMESDMPPEPHSGAPRWVV
jgi:hypothetical protein